ncbi:MAG: GNAT family N-acetyltransferase [Clostridia bacterium]|nr:GNAT family N-acetyltransferase [Clostridia bacterium]
MLKPVYEVDHFRVLKYEPTALNPFYVDMEPTTIMRRLRFLIDLKYGYSVYYLEKEGIMLGYCTITSGKNPRFWFADEKDIIIGPYYIDEKYRGYGYSTKLVDIVINKCETNWEKAYVYILNSNVPSIKVTEKVGGKLIFHVHNTFYRKLIKSNNGEYGVYEVCR